MTITQPARWWPGAAAVATALLVGFAAGPAYPQPAPPPAAPAGSVPVVGGGEPTTTVTLVTGDRVAVSGDPDGATSLTILPAEDGRATPYLSRTAGGDRYLIPTSAIPALAADQLDPELFNVTGLVRQGYDDQHTDALPLIAEYAGAAVTGRSAPAAPAGAEPTAVLGSIDSVALRAGKDTAASLWRDLQRQFSGGPRATAGGRTLRTVWLDRRVTGTLDRSTGQVGAPVAWAAGFDGTGSRVAVLDTGVDGAHPDLAGQVVGSENFSFDGPDDGNGHGTHTASTVAGTGAASDGAKRGVAPGADLLIGKVLDDNGFGFTSSVIAGMEWAVGQAADVVSMSLGGEDFAGCADPLAQAAEQLSGQALFVVSAGNAGPGRHTVSTPGCTPGVLTVAAVDRSDAIAEFSSRGFVPQTHTLKPELAAPGVGISAAAAGGRGDDAYLTASGTSMAAPHVAGAAAILHQANPGWTPRQLKAGLLSAAHTGGVGGVSEVGAGRLDIGAAVAAAVVGPGVVDAGSFPWPQGTDIRAGVDVPYANRSGQPVTLRLAVEDLRGNDGHPAPADMVSLAGETLTVPAGGAAAAALTVHPGRELPLAQYGELGGRLVATAADGTTVSTPFSLFVEPESVDVTLQVIGRDGGAPDTASMNLVSVDTGQTQFGFLAGQDTRTFRLRAGPTFVGAFLSDYDAGGARDGLAEAVTFLAFPEQTFIEDTTLVLDARDAKPVTVTGDRPLEDHSSYLGFGRWSDGWLVSAGIIDPGQINHHYAWSAGEPATGEFEFHTLWRLGAPRLALRTDGADSLDIPARYTSFFSVNDRAMFRGQGRAELADAGTGTPEELAAAGAAGKLVLVENGTTWQTEQVAEAAHAAGAVGVLLHRPEPGRWSPGSSNLLPLASVEAATVAELRGRLAAAGPRDPVTVRWKGQPYSPYQYNLVFAEPDRVPADLSYRADQQQLARVEATWHSVGAVPQTTDWLNYLAPWNPDDHIAVGLPIRVPVPGSRVEYYTPAAGRWRHSTSSAPNLGVPVNAFHTYRPGEKLTEDWFRAVLRPAAGRVFETGELLTVAARRDNAMGFDFRDGYWADSEPSHWSPDRLARGRLELFRDGESLGAAGTWAAGYPVPAGPADYELLLVNSPNLGPNWQRSTRVETRFRFPSQRPTGQVALPIMFPAYQVPLDPDNSVLARLTQVRLSVSGQAGYQPGRISRATLAYSFDGGQSWTSAPVRRRVDEWTAIVDHRGGSGASVTLRVELTGPDGVSVTQTVQDAYTVR